MKKRDPVWLCLPSSPEWCCVSHSRGPDTLPVSGEEVRNGWRVDNEGHRLWWGEEEPDVITLGVKWAPLWVPSLLTPLPKHTPSLWAVFRVLSPTRSCDPPPPHLHCTASAATASITFPDHRNVPDALLASALGPNPPKSTHHGAARVVLLKCQFIHVTLLPGTHPRKWWQHQQASISQKPCKTNSSGIHWWKTYILTYRSPRVSVPLV